MLSGFWNDLRYVLRVLRRNRGFSMVAILSLAIGIGANSAIYSVIQSLLFDPLPVPHPHELALVSWSNTGRYRMSQINSSTRRDADGVSYRTNFSYPIYQAFREAAAGQDVQLGAFTLLREVSATFEGQPAMVVGGTIADAAYFQTLALPIVAGRPLLDSDDEPGAPPVVVLSHGLWQRMFGGDRSVIGRSLRLNGVPFEIVGVTGPGFRGMSRGGFYAQTDLTVPFAVQKTLASGWGNGNPSLKTADDIYWIRIVARTAGGASQSVLEQALTAALRSRVPADESPSPVPPVVKFLPGYQGENAVRPETRRMLLTLSGVVGIVLLIACVNLASLFLARGVARQREIEVRRALGATRFRVGRQLLLESVVLALAGAALGLLLVVGSGSLLSNLLTAGLGSASMFGTLKMEVKVDWLLLAETGILAIVAAVLFGLLPTVRLTNVAPSMHLKHQAAGAASPRLTLGRLLVALQIAISIPLVVGALLFLRTLAGLGAIDIGFNPRSVAMFRLNPAYARVPPEEFNRIYLEALRRIETIPGVASASLVENPLMSGIVSNNMATIDGKQVSLLMNAVGPGFFETMGIPVIEGRTPGVQDREGVRAVGTVNQTAVRTLFGGVSPVGRLITMGNRTVEIVGVVGDSHYEMQRGEVQPILFDSALQRGGFGGHHVVMRTTVPPTTIEPALRIALAELNPDLPLPEIRTQLAQIDQINAKERVFAQLLTIFGAFALLLASIGLHGVTAYSIARRTSEIGLRVALGANRPQIIWLAMRPVVFLATLGLAVGIVLSLWLGPVVSSLLFGVTPNDPATMVLASAIMLGVTIAAGLIPAIRAARLDPLTAIRSE